MAGPTAYLSAVILLTEVRKRFGRRGIEALSGVSLSIAAGECIAITGPNGAGKSTLLALVLGFLHPTHGSVTIDGLEPRAFVRRHGAGWVPERFGLPHAWKVRPTLEHFARLDGHRSDAAAMARSALEHFGLGAHAERPAGDLSHGLGRRLALAIATLSPRRLIVFDEPTEGLDDEGRDRFHERCAWLRSHESTLLLASQDARAVARLADRAVQLDHGRVRDVILVRTGAAPPAAPPPADTADDEE